jgi:hypothetical protein
MPDPAAPPDPKELLRALSRWRTAALVLGVGFAAALGGLVVLAPKGPAAEPIVADVETRKPRAHRRDDDAPRTAPRRPEDELLERLRSVLEKLGWKVISETRSKSQAFEQLTLTGSQGADYVIVNVMDLSDERTAKAMESGYASMVASGSICRREGRRIYLVTLTGTSARGGSVGVSASASSVLAGIAPP